MFAPVVVFEGLPSAEAGGAAPVSPCSITIMPGRPPAGMGISLAQGDFRMMICASCVVQSLKSFFSQGPFAAANNAAVETTASAARPALRFIARPLFETVKT
jgi:hypothetical protein